MKVVVLEKLGARKEECPTIKTKIKLLILAASA
jgi:hypothetical protein